MGIVLVASLAARTAAGTLATIRFDVQPNQFESQVGESVELAICESPLDVDRLPFRVAEVAQALAKRLDQARNC